jgi:hypothetical protein
VTREPSDPDLEALLAEIDGLRLRLTADLGAAAGALDAGAPEVARDALAGAQDDVAVFALRSDRALQDAGAAAVAGEPAAVVRPLRRRAGQRLGVLAPALTAAAALVAVLVGVVPSAGPTAAQRPPITSAAASYAELLRLHEAGASAPRLAAAVRRLRADVARLVALAADDPATAEQALRLLEQEAALLRTLDGEPLPPELAASQRLLAALREAVRDAGGGVLLAGPPAVMPLLPPSVRPPSPQALDRTAVPQPRQGVAGGSAPAVEELRSVVPPRPQPAPAASSTATSAPAQPPAEQQPAGEPEEQPAPQPEPSPQPSASPKPDPSDPRTWFGGSSGAPLRGL